MINNDLPECLYTDVALYGKRDVADAIILGILRWGTSLVNQAGMTLITEGLVRVQQQIRETGEEEAM